MRAGHRIDVHQHVVPPFWAKVLSDHDGDPSHSCGLNGVGNSLRGIIKG